MAAPPNQALHLSGAAIPVSRDMKVLQAAPACELGRSAELREIRVLGEVMAIRHLAVSLLLFFGFVLRGVEPDSTSRRSSPSDNHSPPAREGKEARTLRKKPGVTCEAKDWPME